MGDAVGISPRISGIVALGLTESTHLGAMADWVEHGTKDSLAHGSQWRAMVVLQWSRQPEWLPDWCTLYGQFGVGLGQVDHADSVRYLIVGPASRLAAGIELRLRDRLRCTVDIGLDRLDAAIGPHNKRKYPTMLGVRVGVSFDAPHGRPLISSAPTHVRSVGRQR